MSETPRLRLPYLAPGQAQKELLHNEALELVDMVIDPVVEDMTIGSPPERPVFGSCYVVPSSTTDDWAGHQGSLACFTSAGWRFVEPFEGLTVLRRQDATNAVFREGAWRVGEVRGSRLIIDGQQVVGSRAAAIVPPDGGAVIDVEARAALAAILEALREHGLIESSESGQPQ